MREVKTLNRVAAATFLVPLLFALVLLVRPRADEEAPVSLLSQPTTPATSPPAQDASKIIGVASVVDGDTLEIHGTRIRLNGIDAPESGQICFASGQKYRCGQSAALFLNEAIGGQQVSCDPLSHDKYGRTVARCTAKNYDLGLVMVENGWALAYRKYDAVYVPQEDSAREARRGIWAGEFVEPWLWRAGQRLEGVEHGG